MSRVFVAIETALGRRVAMKVLAPEQAIRRNPGHAEAHTS